MLNTRKPPDMRILYNETGDYFIGSKKECDDFIEENNLTVLENDKNERNRSV